MRERSNKSAVLANATHGITCHQRIACLSLARRYVKKRNTICFGTISHSGVRENFVAAEDAINFKAIFASVPTPLLVLARDLTIVDMNDCYAQVVGRTRDDLVGKPLFEAFPGPDGNVRVLRDSIQRVFASGKADFVPLIHYPIPAPREGPSDVRTGFRDSYWSCSHVPVTTPDGQVRYVLQNSQDVTELHRSNAANPVQAKADEQLGTSVLHRAERVQALNASLLAETAQLRNLFMRAPSFMCLLRGPEYRIELANSAFMHLVGDRKLSDRKSTRLNSSHSGESRMPSSA